MASKSFLSLAVVCLVVVEGFYLRHDVKHGRRSELADHPKDKIDELLTKGLSGFMVLENVKATTSQSPADNQDFRGKCLDTARSLAVANGGSKKKVNAALVISCSRHTYAPRAKACNMFRETLQKHMSAQPSWNLQKMDYQLFCDGFYKVLGKPSAQHVIMSGVSEGTLIDCAGAVQKVISRIPQPVLNMGATLVTACDIKAVQKEIGGEQASCERLMQELAKEHARGNEDYFPFCRALKMQNPGFLKDMMDDLKNNPNISKALNTCKEHCPQISKMARNYLVINAIRQNMMDMFMNAMNKMMSGEVEMGSAEEVEMQIKMQKAIEGNMSAALNSMVQMCDFKRTAKCTPENMHQSCSSGLDIIAPLFSDGLKEQWEMCELRRPCNDVCQGFLTKADVFLTAFMRVNMRSPFQANTLANDTKAMCSSYGPVKQCLAKQECSEFVKMTPLMMVLYVVDTTEKSCD